MTIQRIYTVLLFAIIATVLAIPSVHAQASCTYAVTFNAEPTSGSAYITISISGILQGHEVYLHWGIEPYPQGPWSEVTDTPMTWNSENYTVTRAIPARDLGCLGIP